MEKEKIVAITESEMIFKGTKAFACFSGGKESVLSYYRALKSGISISYLVNMVSEDGERCRSHGVSSDCLKLQSDAIGVPVIQRKTSWQNYENEFKKIISDLKNEGIKIGIFGDIDLQEHRDWVERVCKDIEIKPILPLWKGKREELLKDFIQLGFRAIVIATQAFSMGKEWLGRKIDAEFIKNLKDLDNIDLCGEKGEYHTFVFNGPIFKKPVEIKTGEKIFRDNHWFLKIIPKLNK
ncbi:MAG: diphthine--ammonia ligase [Thermodesulfobacteriota bacterium]|nr:diphthine--ammonia ligase [Thermodesulfobacteriota bacterium]